MVIKKVNKMWTCRVWYYVGDERKSSFKGKFSKKSDAELWGAEIEKRVQLYPDPVADIILLSELFETYINAKKNRIKPESTSSYSQRAKHILRFLGDYPLNKLTTKIIQQYVSSSNYSPNAYDFLTESLRYAFDTELMFKKPQNKVIKPGDKKKAIRALNMETLASLLTALKKESLSIYIAVLSASLCGLRCGEVLGLEWDDFDFAAHTLKIQRTKHRDNTTGTPKSGKPRTLHLNSYLESELLEYRMCLQAQGILCKEVLVSFGTANSSCKPYGQDGFYTAWRRILKHIGWEQITFHAFRHTFATLFISAGGGSIDQLKIALGHSNIITTQRYTHNDNNVEYISVPIDLLGKSVELCKKNMG